MPDNLLIAALGNLLSRSPTSAPCPFPPNLYEGYIDKETRKLSNKQFAASKRCIGEEIKRQMSHNIYISKTYLLSPSLKIFI